MATSSERAVIPRIKSGGRLFETGASRPPQDKVGASPIVYVGMTDTCSVNGSKRCVYTLALQGRVKTETADRQPAYSAATRAIGSLEGQHHGQISNTCDTCHTTIEIRITSAAHQRGITSITGADATHP